MSDRACTNPKHAQMGEHEWIVVGRKGRCCDYRDCTGDHKRRSATAGICLVTLESLRARSRIDNMTPEQIERKRSRGRMDNMTPGQIESQRARQRVANMTLEQIEHQRAGDRVENMTPRELERRHAYATSWKYLVVRLRFEAKSTLRKAGRDDQATL